MIPRSIAVSLEDELLHAGSGVKVSSMPDKTRELRDRFAVGCALVAVPLGLACSSGHDLPGMATGNTVSSGGREGQSAATPCTDGETRKCTKTLAQHGSVLSCYDGTETCRGSEWSQCEAGTVTLTSLPLGGQRRLQSVTQPPSRCVDANANPCDPSCQIFDGGDASTPVVAQVNSVTGWWTGDQSQLPPDVQAALSKPSCETAADCQQNQHCVNVATDGSCTHDKCTAGVALDSACDPCVQTICEQTPACCQTSVAPKCADGELQDAAGRCYYYLSTPSTWQAARTACLSRGTDWDLVCVTSQVEQDFLAENAVSNAWLGIIRAGNGFECADHQPLLAAGAALSSPPWNSGEPNNWYNSESCGEMYVGGAWNDFSCAHSLTAWCAGPAASGSLDWSGSCVSAVASVCGASCDSSGTHQSATCQGWSPGQSNPSDSSFDLAIDVACNGQVPVCNHGTRAAPAGAVVHVLDEDLTMIGGEAPDLSAELGQCDVPTIESGGCVLVSGCSRLLSQQNAALWVQVPSGSESRTDDNWSYSVAGTACILPHCLNASGTKPCVTSYVYSEDYLGTCTASDALPQWSYLQFSAALPGDSSIDFQVVTAATIDELATTKPIPLVTASAAAGITDCLLSGPAPKCPVDLYAAILPSGSAQNKYLRLIVTLNPSSDGTQSPALDFWRISFACPDST
jgi:hypothetical protein